LLLFVLYQVLNGLPFEFNDVFILEVSAVKVQKIPIFNVFIKFQLIQRREKVRLGRVPSGRRLI
jgi:hypothetical protein